MPYCPNCGAECAEDANFCSNCGRVVGSAAASIPPQQKDQPVLEIGGPTTHGLGHATMYGRIRLFNDRLEFDKRTSHVVIPIEQVSGVATEGLIKRKIKVFSKTGDLIELESAYISNQDYDRLSAALRRIQSGENLGPNQILQEENEQLGRHLEDSWQGTKKDVKQHYDRLSTTARRVSSGENPMKVVGEQLWQDLKDSWRGKSSGD